MFFKEFLPRWKLNTLLTDAAKFKRSILSRDNRLPNNNAEVLNGINTRVSQMIDEIFQGCDAVFIAKVLAEPSTCVLISCCICIGIVPYFPLENVMSPLGHKELPYNSTIRQKFAGMIDTALASNSLDNENRRSLAIKLQRLRGDDPVAMGTKIAVGEEHLQYSLLDTDIDPMIQKQLGAITMIEETDRSKTAITHLTSISAEFQSGVKMFLLDGLDHKLDRYSTHYQQHRIGFVLNINLGHYIAVGIVLKNPRYTLAQLQDKFAAAKATDTAKGNDLLISALYNDLYQHIEIQYWDTLGYGLDDKIQRLIRRNLDGLLAHAAIQPQPINKQRGSTCGDHDVDIVCQFLQYGTVRVQNDSNTLREKNMRENSELADRISYFLRGAVHPSEPSHQQSRIWQARSLREASEIQQTRAAAAQTTSTPQPVSQRSGVVSFVANFLDKMRGNDPEERRRLLEEQSDVRSTKADVAHKESETEMTMTSYQNTLA